MSTSEFHADRVGTARPWREAPQFKLHESEQPRGHWFLEPGLALLILFIIVSFFLRLGDLTLRGEETRRTQIAREMAWTGDWFVPRQQGVPFLSRPPLGNWLIALAAWLRGECDTWAIRLPSALATLATALLVYAYAGRFLSTIGALAAGAAFATMGQVLELGRLGETEAVFTLLVGASLLLWHALYVDRGSNWSAWQIGYTLAALGALAKGPQAPVYFIAITGSYLLWKRDWRGLFSLPHLAGLGSFSLILCAYLFPVYQDLGMNGVRALWTGDVGLRFIDLRWSTLATHYLRFPIETFACMLPGSLALLALLSRRVRQGLETEGRRHLGFLLLCLIVTFPTCWATPSARTRYFMPLYPCVAIIAGIVLDRVLSEASRRGRFWRLGLVASAGAMAFVYNVPVLNRMCANSEDTVGAVAELRRRLPSDHRLVSFDSVHHLFAYHYGDPIELRPFPSDSRGLDDGKTYFCFDRYHRPEENLPFAWEEVAVISRERTRRTPPGWVVRVGRVKPDK